VVNLCLRGVITDVQVRDLVL